VNNNDDLRAIDTYSILEEFVFEDESSLREYLRQEWLEGIFAQLVEARLAAGLSQAHLGKRLGKPQSSIARLERGSDLKLSVLWDYLAAVGKTPQQKLVLEEISEVEDRLCKYFSREPETKPVLRGKNWMNVPKPGQVSLHHLQPQRETHGELASESHEPVQKDQAA
jgi:transcriptional regulator with XRE-family HTH domain